MVGVADSAFFHIVQRKVSQIMQLCIMEKKTYGGTEMLSKGD